MSINFITLFLDVITFGIYGAVKTHNEILRERNYYWATRFVKNEQSLKSENKTIRFRKRI